MVLGSSESAEHSIFFHFVWNEMNIDANIFAHLSIGTKISGQQSLTGFVELFSLVTVDNLCSHQGHRQRGPVVPGPPFWNLFPPISRFAPGCSIHPIPYFIASGFWPLHLVLSHTAAKSWQRTWFTC